MLRPTKSDLSAPPPCGALGAPPRTTSVRVRTLRRNAFATALIAPAAIVLAFVVGYPTVRAIVISLTAYKIGNPSHSFVGLDNFSSVLRDQAFPTAVTNSLEFTGFSTALSFSAGFGLALLLREGIFGRAIFRSALLTPWLIPVISFALLWQWMLNPQYGVVNALLMQVGLVSEPQAWLGDASTAIPAVIIGNAWQQTPFVMIMMLAALQTVSQELRDAARVDGAGVHRIFRHIVLPRVRGIATIVTLVLIIWNLQSFALIDLLTGGGPADRTLTLSIYLFNLGFKSYNFGQAAAASSMITVALIFFSAFYVRTAGGER